jgi:predicted GIY-YIG superfamily endonuclease
MSVIRKTKKSKQDLFKKSFFWIESYEHHEDWFVVAADQYVAEKYFCANEGYDMDLVSSEEICIANFEDKEGKTLDAYFPSHKMLTKNGFEFISELEPRIVWRAGRKFCQGNIMTQIILELKGKKPGVYIIEVRDTGLFKIGLTKDIKKRLSQFQTSNPYEFYLRGFFLTEKHRELEKILHTKYKLKCYKREWFKLTHKEYLQACKTANNFINKDVKTKKHSS